MEVEQPAFLCQQEAEILLRRQLGDSAQEFVRRLVARRRPCVGALLLERGKLTLGDAERLVGSRSANPGVWNLRCR